MKKLILLIALLGIISAACGEKKVVKKDVKKELPKITQEEQLKLDAPANEKKGLEACKRKDHKSAKKYFELTLKGNPNSFEALYRLGKINFHDSNYEAAEDYFRRAIAVNDKNNNLKLVYGNLLIKMNRWPDAKEFFEIQFAKDPKFAEAAISLLAIYKHLVEKEKDSKKIEQLVKKAEGFAQKALKEIPGDSAIYNNLGQLYYLAGKKSLAFYVLSIAEKNDEKSPIVLNTIGVYYENEKNEFLAKRYYKLALKNNPDYTPALKNLVRFQIEALNYTDAKKNFEKIIKAEPDNINALYGLAISELGLFNFTEAIKKFEGLFNKTKDSKYALMIAEVYYKNLNQNPKYQEKPKERKKFLSEAKKWYKLYVDAHKELRKDNDIVMIYNSIDSEIKMIDNPDNLKTPEENKKVELTEEQKKKKEEILKQRKEAEIQAKKDECLKEGKSEEECNIIVKKYELQEKYDTCVETKSEEECASILKELENVMNGKEEVNKTDDSGKVVSDKNGDNKKAEKKENVKKETKAEPKKEAPKSKDKPKK